MSDIRSIAFYLPQYHPIPENDVWWGKGFTEWTNVTKAKPLFNGHYQPRLPTELGFYDLRLHEARQAQADLASEYGIFGFCYYYYWFSGKKLLERPLEEVLKLGKPDFPFMICWANENWSRRWDGSEDKILIKQEYNPNDSIELFKSLLPYFKDRRYIKVYDKPVLAIYNTSAIPDFRNFIEKFRNEGLRNGISVYIMGIEGFNRTEAKSYSNVIDATIEFQPFGETLKAYKSKYLYSKSFKYLSNRIACKVYKKIGLKNIYEKKWSEYYHRVDYEHYVDFIIKNYKYPKDYKRYPGVAPFWDNSPRMGERATIFRNESPEKYGKWLKFHRNHFIPYSAEENFVFINAWNEWAEGNHLEPCLRWGRRYLQETKESLS